MNMQRRTFLIKSLGVGLLGWLTPSMLFANDRDDDDDDR